MNRYFVDTSFYVAVVNLRDALHARAREIAEALAGKAITTEFVLAEVGNMLASSGDRPVFVELVRRLDTDPHTAIVPASSQLFRQGLLLYSNRPDKS